MANSTEQIRLIKPEDTGTIINIIAELEQMKDTYLVKEKHRIGEYNMERVLEIVKNVEFLRKIARSLDEQGKNKKELDQIRSLTTEEIIAQMEQNNKMNKRLNAIIVIMTVTFLAAAFFIIV